MFRSKHLITFAAVVALFAACGFAQAQAPTTAPSSAEHLKATVTGVEGIVQVRSGEDAKWEKAAVGMEVTENAEFRTGPKSAVRFVISLDQTITLDRLGTVKVLQAINDNGKIKTNLGMRYGRTRYDIEAAGREHEASIVSPSSTLAIRGTKVSLYDQRPFPAEAVSLTGRAEFRDSKKRTFFGNKNAGKTKIDTDNSSAASYALNQAVVDPGVRWARTAAEEKLVTTLLSSGATVGFDYNKGIRVVRGGTVPGTDAALLPILPGVLNFVMRWQANSDLNLAVVSPGTGPGNRTVYPLGGFDSVKSGGHTPFDHRGGKNGGIEIAYWLNSFPSGVYFIGAQLISGPNTQATFDVFQNGQRVPIQTAGGSVTTASALIQPIDPNIATAIGVGTVRLTGTQSAPANKPAKIAPAVMGPVQIVKTGKR